MNNRLFFKKISLFFALLWAFFSPAVEAIPTLTLVLDWYINPNHAPIILAQEQGFFKQQGLEVKIITPADPTDPPKWVAMGRADIAIDYTPHLLLMMKKGLPVEPMGTLIGQPLSCLVALGSSSIKTLSGLKGKPIAYSSPEVDLLLLKVMLKRVNLSLKDVQVTNVHYGLTQSLLSRQVSAAMGMMRNVELPELKSLGQSYHAFFPEDYGVPFYSELVFLSRKEAKTDPRYVLFFKALNEAGRYLKSHPDDSWQVFIKGHSDRDTVINKDIWNQTFPKFVNDFAKVNEEQWKNIELFVESQSKE